MGRAVFFSLLVHFLISRAHILTKPTDPIFQSYMEEFKREYQVELTGIRVYFKDNLDPNGNTIGTCHFFTGVINIDTAWWLAATEAERKLIIYHELGHCKFFRFHDETKYPDGCPKSIMYPEILGKKCLKAHEDELYKELH